MRGRTVAAVAAGLAVVLLGYGALDVADRVPGPLTRAPLPVAAPRPSPAPTVTQPRAVDAAGPLAAASTAPVPTPAGLRAALAARLADPRLGSLGATVRDAATGEHLLDLDATTPRIPASTVKLLAAAAVDATFPAGARLTTRAVAGGAPDRVVLVAGGDTLLAPGRGDPSAVAGRAGLGDLARQVAAALRAGGTARVTVALDASYAAGATTAPTWAPDYRPSGITGAVAAIGLSTQRAVPGRPGPADPGAASLQAFAAALRGAGLTVAVDPAPARAGAGAAALGAVISAPVADQLALALRDSDNALTESLARQASARSGGGTGFPQVAAFVRATLGRLGVDTTGVSTVDASGLSREDRVPARVVGDVLGLAATGSGRLPSLRGTVADLAVGGLSGTLAGRYDDPATRAGAGVVHGKTGTLTGVSGLAGTVSTADGRVLTFALLANDVPSATGTPGAQEALDEVVTTLAGCGCR
ncbi:D-alanyl-D-alanine carboxypeptidase/D-alanyl-D-alanine-endopeptidase [Lapillicoccus jejuensis]|uniref:D-alanyl-D-alanine carboxypeptidase/D-alanyl-D-alanine-endopeptidase (Penicillin-binding protein 4) n=1 Tax=Lapillicoccus jejuensis TaxID=402171 RepID=A0A542DXG9_9MICO|nr:D-alanyl-D-alanine carboxypeptidase [Lapillicoccus jejuensis]TQJ07776.1 D-alanyl-D-alanine carboxypeptidase/D-alanyl-D-alanine-endopeptidase (penicillin-binding protein 4) [Lapillicoccus jejuensis]